MKKNVMMRIASILLVCVLATTCGISGTFAKYVTEGTGSDSARVAKWGVTVTAESSMFSQEYLTDDNTFSGTYSVSAAEDVVAPGTKGDMVAIVISGKPEVAARVTYTPTVDLGNNWIDKDDTTKFYCPLKVTVNGVVLCGLDYASAEEFEKAIADNIAGATKDYAPGTDLSVAGSDLDISWEWAFEADGDYICNDQTDAKDTFLGDRAAADEANAGTISIALVVTITQID